MACPRARVPAVRLAAYLWCHADHGTAPRLQVISQSSGPSTREISARSENHLCRNIALFVAIFFLSLDIPAAAGQSSTSPTLTLQTGQTAEAVSIAINPDGRQLAAGNAHAITFWDRQNGWILKSLTGHSGNINSVVFSPDGNWLASGSDNGEIAFWNSKTSDREALKSVNKSAIACAFIPEVERCHSFCCVGQHYRLWDDGACQNSCVLTTTSELPSTMVISADESWLAVGTDHWVHV